MPTPLALLPPPLDAVLLPPLDGFPLSDVVLLPHAVAVSASAAETTPAAAILDTRRKRVPFGWSAPSGAG
jgi:hypothetical protein